MAVHPPHSNPGLPSNAGTASSLSRCNNSGLQHADLGLTAARYGQINLGEELRSPAVRSEDSFIQSTPYSYLDAVPPNFINAPQHARASTPVFPTESSFVSPEQDPAGFHLDQSSTQQARSPQHYTATLQSGEGCIDPSLLSNPSIPVFHRSPQPIMRPKGDLLTATLGTPAQFQSSRSTPPYDRGTYTNYLPVTPPLRPPHVLSNNECHGRLENPLTPNPTPQGTDKHPKYITKTVRRQVKTFPIHGTRSDQYRKPTRQAGTQAMPRTSPTGIFRNNRKATKTPHETPATTSSPSGFPITPQAHGRETKRFCADPSLSVPQFADQDSDLLSLRNNFRPPLVPYIPVHNREPGPYSLEKLVERWISRHPRDFPGDADIAGIVNMAEGSLNEEEVKECFRNNFWPKADQDSGFHSHGMTAYNSDISTDPTHVSRRQLNKRMQFDEQEQVNPPQNTPENMIPCGFEGCVATFSRSYERDRHRNSFHEDPKWKCLICYKMYTRKDKLRDHLRLKHPDFNEEQIQASFGSHDPDRDDDPGDVGSSGSRTTKQQPRGNQGGYDDVGTTKDSSREFGSSSSSRYTHATTMSRCTNDSKALGDLIDGKHPARARYSSPSRSCSALRTNMKVESKTASHLFSVQGDIPALERKPLPFRTVKSLGQGAHGSVDKVEYHIGGKVFARKTIKLKSDHAIHLMEQEVQLLKFMRHPHIVELEGAFTDGPAACLLLPVADCDLRQLMHLSLQDKRLAQSNISLWVWELTSALKYLHSADVSVVHGDLKPANILVFDSHVRITDFGSASFSNRVSQPPRPGPFTEVYAAPEAFNDSEWGQKADVFSLGCVFVEMSTVLMRIPLDTFEVSRTTTAGNGRQNSSFHGHLPRVREWISKLRSRSSRHKFVSRVLDWCDQMLQDEPERRPKASTIARDMEHSMCSTCSRNDALDEEANCCNKCTAVNIPRKFSPSSSSETGRPRYTLEKFQHHRDDTERLLVMQESVRSIHHQSLQSFLERFDIQFCPSAYHTLQASDAFGR